MMNNKQKFYNKIFYNNKYLLIFSIVVAVIIWVAVVMEFSPENEYTIYNVPVSVSTKGTSAEVAGLQPFGVDDLKVDVTIGGPRYSIRKTDISPDDLKIEAVISNVTHVGEYELKLKYSILSKTATYSIESLSKDSVLVYFDSYTSSRSIPIVLNGVPEENLAEEGMYCKGAVLSQNSVSLSGATSQINSIGDTLYATFDSSKFNFPLSDTVNFDVDLLMQSKSGNSLKYVTIDDNPKITGSIPVLSIKNVDTSISFKNSPLTSGNSIPPYISYTISPSTVDIAAAKEVLGSMMSLDVGVIDYRNIKAGKNVFTFKSEFISSAKVADESVTEFTVTVNAFDVTSFTKNIPSSCVNFKNIPDGYKADLVFSTNCIQKAVFVGSASSLEKLSDSDIEVSVDMASITEVKEGINEISAIIYCKKNDVWAYGQYTVAVNITKT